MFLKLTIEFDLIIQQYHIYRRSCNMCENVFEWYYWPLCTYRGSSMCCNWYM